MTEQPRWEGHSHEEIYAAVHRGPGREVSLAAEGAWEATEALIVRIEERLAAAMGTSGSGWEGAAADATRGAMSPLGSWAADAAGDAKLTAGAVVAQAEHAGRLRSLMPPPHTAEWQAAVGRTLSDEGYVLQGLQDMAAIEEKAAADAADAVRLMNDYTNHSDETRRHLNYSTFPPSVTVETAAAGTAGGSPIGGGGGWGSGWGSGGWGSAIGVAAADRPGVGGGFGGSGAPSPGGAAPALVAGAPSVVSGGPPGAATVGPGLPVGVPASGGGSADGRWPSGTIGGGSDGPGPTGSPAATTVQRTPVPSAGSSRGGNGGGNAAYRASGADPGGPPPGVLPRGERPPAAGKGLSPRSPGGRTPTGSAPSGGGLRPLVPGPAPRSGPAPSWRDLLPQPSHSGPRVPPLPGGPDPGRGAGVGPRFGSGGVGESPAAPGRGTASAVPAVAEPGARTSGARAPTAAHPGLYPPMTAGGTGGQDRERRRPDYLVDDSDAFTDDRWFTPPVIGADDRPPPRRR